MTTPTRKIRSGGAERLRNPAGAEREFRVAILGSPSSGKSALVQKLHHTIADGETSVKLSLQFLDFDRDAPEPPPIKPAAADQPTDAPSAHSNQDLLRDLVAGSLRMPLGLVKMLERVLESLPSRLQRRLGRAPLIRNLVSAPLRAIK